EGLLGAVAVQERASADGRERQGADEVARHELLEQERARCEPARLLALEQRRNLVAEPDQATRLEADHRDAARHERRERLDAALRFAPRLVDLADREKRASAARRAAGRL